MSHAAAHVRLFSMHLLNVVSLLLDGEWLELRHCPFNATNRAAEEPCPPLALVEPHARHY